MQRSKFVSQPRGLTRTLSAFTRIDCWRAVCAVLVLLAATSIAAPAQTFTTLAEFDTAIGTGPLYASLVQGFDGNFYGTTSQNGGGFGSVFRVTPSGELTSLHAFCHSDCTDGASPSSGLVQATDGTLYGTTIGGGAANSGTVFKITPGGTLTTLYSFCTQANCADGHSPIAGLTQASNGNLYGTTSAGGANDWGTVFKITTAGVLTTLHSFDVRADGGRPQGGQLIQATNGALYGVTFQGGANGDGTIYRITAAGKLTTLHSFERLVDGTGFYNNGLVQATDGNLYGTNFTGSANGQGTVFRITPGGALTTIYRFCGQPNCTDGAGPIAGLVQGTDGNLYGETVLGGANGTGTIFKISTGGVLTTLYSLAATDAEGPYDALLQSTNGTFYGTTRLSGINHLGTAFSFSMGLAPFVKTLPASGKVGASVTILGSSLTGATAVSFNGVAAVFTVVSNSEIKTTVPGGATTGKVTVVTPGGSLKTNVTFRVTHHK